MLENSQGLVLSLQYATNLYVYFVIYKDEESLFNITYNETDNISSQAILRHNNIFNRYLPALLYLSSTTPFYGSVSKGAASTILTKLITAVKPV